jgi:hypothetical protein
MSTTTNPEQFFCQACKSGFPNQEKLTIHNRKFHKFEPLVDEREKDIERGEQKDKKASDKREDKAEGGGHPVM